MVRRLGANATPGSAYLSRWHWPFMLHAVDVVAWDMFFGLALLLAVPRGSCHGTHGRMQRVAHGRLSLDLRQDRSSGRSHHVEGDRDTRPPPAGPGRSPMTRRIVDG